MTSATAPAKKPVRHKTSNVQKAWADWWLHKGKNSVSKERELEDEGLDEADGGASSHC